MIPYMLMTLALLVAFLLIDCWAYTCPPFVETYEGRYD